MRRDEADGEEVRHPPSELRDAISEILRLRVKDNVRPRNLAAVKGFLQFAVPTWKEITGDSGSTWHIADHGSAEDA